MVRILSIIQIVHRLSRTADSKFAPCSVCKRREAQTAIPIAIVKRQQIFTQLLGIDAATLNLINRSIIRRMYLFSRGISGSEALPAKTVFARRYTG